MKTAIYWGCTAVLGLAMLAAGIMNLMGGPDVAANMASMGYPAYLASILGVYKVLSVPAMVAPTSTVIKQSAYAGLFFVLTGAAISHLASGHGLAGAAPALVMLGLWTGSYLLHEEVGLSPASA